MPEIQAKNTALHIAAVIFSLIGLIHLYRAVRGYPITVGNFSLPLWASYLAFIILAGVAWWMWKESR